MAAFTVMIDRSRAINAFGTYRGASVMERRTFAWNLSRISMLDLEAKPQSWDLIWNYNYWWFGQYESNLLVFSLKHRSADWILTPSLSGKYTQFGTIGGASLHLRAPQWTQGKICELNRTYIICGSYEENVKMTHAWLCEDVLFLCSNCIGVSFT
jgi:hypothetical protein